MYFKLNHPIITSHHEHSLPKARFIITSSKMKITFILIKWTDQYVIFESKFEKKATLQTTCIKITTNTSCSANRQNNL